MKENDGKAARRLLTRKIAAVLGVFGVIFVVVVWVKQPQLPAAETSSASRRQIQQQQLPVLGNRPRIRQRLPAQKKLSSQHLQGEILDDHPTTPEEGEKVAAAAKKKKGSTSEFLGDEHMQQIMEAKVHLVDLEIAYNEVSEADDGTYAGVYGIFCRVNWSVHKEDPSKVPMFRDVVNNSPDCSNDLSFKADLQTVVERVRAYDQEIADQGSAATPKVLNLTAVVFHESRCGSTLVANVFAAMNPAAHRVYSESPPPVTALRSVCGENYDQCSKSVAAQLLQDVLYLMSRSDDPEEERVFFKIQSIGSRNIEVFQEAFPDTPWLFVYREPVQVMMSQLEHGTRYANCVRPQFSSFQPPSVVQSIKRHATSADAARSVRKLSPEQYCAAHLASITETAVRRLDRRAIPINYRDLPERLWEEILPQRLGVFTGPAEIHRMEITGRQYSKGRDGKGGTFQQDSEKKEKKASQEIRQASQQFLAESYEALENAAAEMKKQQS